jgi:hypothetical protein
MNDQVSPSANEPKKNNTTMIIVIVVVVLLCCCCITVAGLWQYGDQIMQYFGK